MSEKLWTSSTATAPSTPPPRRRRQRRQTAAPARLAALAAARPGGAHRAASRSSGCDPTRAGRVERGAHRGHASCARTASTSVARRRACPPRSSCRPERRSRAWATDESAARAAASRCAPRLPSSRASRCRHQAPARRTPRLAVSAPVGARRARDAAERRGALPRHDRVDEARAAASGSSSPTRPSAARRAPRALGRALRRPPTGRSRGTGPHRRQGPTSVRSKTNWTGESTPAKIARSVTRRSKTRCTLTIGEVPRRDATPVEHPGRARRRDRRAGPRRPRRRRCDRRVLGGHHVACAVLSERVDRRAGARPTPARRAGRGAHGSRAARGGAPATSRCRRRRGGRAAGRGTPGRRARGRPRRRAG